MRLFAHFVRRDAALIIAIDTLAIVVALAAAEIYLFLDEEKIILGAGVESFAEIVSFGLLVFYITSESKINQIRNPYFSKKIKIKQFLGNVTFLFILYMTVWALLFGRHMEVKVSSLFLMAGIFAAIGCAGIFLSRQLLPIVLRLYGDPRHVLVVGFPSDAQKWRTLFADADAAAPPLITSFWHEVEALGAPSSLRDFVSRNKVSEIVITSAVAPEGLKTQLLDCKFSGVRISDLSSFHERLEHRLDVEVIDDDWLLKCDGFDRDVDTKLKRALDIVVSLGLLVVTFPLCLLVVLAIRFEGPGPILFAQDRIGRDGKPFRILKFRSMVVEAGGPGWTADGDRRITAVGRWIRRFRIDEIPQALNVLQGTMSIIGPRPEQPTLVDMLADAMPYYHERHRVRPGITGWAQVNYKYGASIEDARRKLSYDLYYIKNFSFILDVIIIARTIKVIIAPNFSR